MELSKKKKSLVLTFSIMHKNYSSQIQCFSRGLTTNTFFVRLPTSVDFKRTSELLYTYFHFVVVYFPVFLINCITLSVVFYTIFCQLS